MKIILSLALLLVLNFANGQPKPKCYSKTSLGFETLTNFDKKSIANSSFVDMRMVYDDGKWPRSIKSYNSEYVTLYHYFAIKKLGRNIPYFVSQSPKLKYYFIGYMPIDTLRLFGFKSRMLKYVELYYCSISKIDTAHFSGYNMPKILVLDHCSIDSIEDQMINRLYMSKRLVYIKRDSYIKK